MRMSVYVAEKPPHLSPCTSVLADRGHFSLSFQSDRWGQEGNSEQVDWGALAGRGDRMARVPTGGGVPSVVCWGGSGLPLPVPLSRPLCPSLQHCGLPSPSSFVPLSSETWLSLDLQLTHTPAPLPLHCLTPNRLQPTPGDQTGDQTVPPWEAPPTLPQRWGQLSGV